MDARVIEHNPCYTSPEGTEKPRVSKRKAQGRNFYK